MPAHPVPYITPEEYLEMERAAAYKSEYFSGQMWTMSGVSRHHDAIAFSSIIAVGNALRGKPCRGFTSDMRVTVEGALFTYPDLTIVCGEPQFTDANLDTLSNPTMLFEILSPSTENYDRNAKFGRYRRLSFLREYVLIHQDEPFVERFVKMDALWQPPYEYRGLEAVLEMDSIGISVPLSLLYENAPFPD